MTGLDVAAYLVKQARTRAAQDALDIQIDEGDAESLPYPNASFDVVMSLIGSMFAPRPELVVSEMIRVCRPGGRIVMGNWTPEGHVGQMFRVIGKHVPPPQMPSPLLWGDEATCRQRLDGVKDLKFTRYMYPFEYPFAPAAVVDVFVEYYGPTNRAYASLSDPGRQALHADLTALWTRNNKATDGTTRVLAEYIEVIATNRRHVWEPSPVVLGLAAPILQGVEAAPLPHAARAAWNIRGALTITAKCRRSA